MEKKSKVDPKGQTMLSHEEMRSFNGGLHAETIVKIILSGAGYFFRSSVSEAKRMKILL